MPYNSIIDRSGSSALMPEEAVREIFQGATEKSVVMALGRRLPNMSRGQSRLPVLNSLPSAYFVTGDTGQKQTTKVDWTNKYLNAEEIAVIVPIPQAVLDDSDYNIWSEVRPLIEEAIGLTFDQAVIHGTNAPASWPTNLVAGATAASNNLALGTYADLYEDTLGENGIISKLEADGFMATGHVAAMSMRGKLRGVRAADGQLIFSNSMQQPGSYQLDGERILFPRTGAINTSAAQMLSGEWSQLVWVSRMDMETKLLTEAVIQDAAGNIIYNLAQQDMVALRVVTRMAWQLPNPVNRLNTNSATRYPFAVLT